MDASFPRNATVCKNVFCANVIIQSTVVSSNTGLESWIGKLKG